MTKKIKIIKKLKIYNLLNIIKRKKSFKELIEMFESQDKKGHIFERIWDIIIKLGIFDKFQSEDYEHIVGNVNLGKPKFLVDYKSYFNEYVNNGNSSGVSDITLYNKKEKKYIFFSSKYPKDKKSLSEQKDIKYYDIQNILAVINQNKHIYKKYEIYLLVPNKKKFSVKSSKCNKSSSYIVDNINDIFDSEDLEKYFIILKDKIKNLNTDEICSNYNLKKEPLILRFHQDFLTDKSLVKINEGEKNILWGWKCRAGKTYGIGGICLKYFEIYKNINCMVITPAPSETIPQFTKELFYKFRDFDRLNIIEVKDGKEFEKIDFEENNIIVISKQLLDNYVDKKINKKLKDLKLDLIIFDENHFGGTTENSSKIIENYQNDKTVKIFLTATYHKTAHKWNIPQDCQFYWDIEDEQLCKKRDIKGLEMRHGKCIYKFINEENKEYLLQIYDNMPDLHILSTLIDQKKYEIIKDIIMDTKYGFSMEVLLSLDKKGEHFQFPNEVEKVLRYISGSNRMEDFPIGGDKSIFSRIKNISNDNNSRTNLTNENFTTQLWFLPFGCGMPIDKVSVCLEKKIKNDGELSNFDTLIINSKKQYRLKDLKAEINKKEIEAMESGKRGLILLAGNQCSLGITLPLVDVVMLLNNTMSSDKILQMMYRCMSETLDGSKKIGFVVDLNISRVLHTFLEYNVNDRDLTVEQKFEYIIENNLINIDNDLLDNKENKSKIVEKLVSEWKKDPVNNFKRLLKKIENYIIDVDSEDQRMINKAFVHTTSDGNYTLKMDDDIKQDLPSGKTKIKKSKTSGETDSEDDSDTANEDNEKNISFSKEVLPFIIPLVCILTMKDENKDILDMINIIKENNELLEVFNEQSFIWWNKKEIINFIKNIISKYLKKNSEAYSIAVQFKMELKSLIDEPEKLLQLIDSCLKPKLVEKKKFGEVFTPMNIINEMLDKLDENYKLKHKNSIFTEMNFKWLDPANGMGNFPIVIYFRLMEGLKKKIPDDMKRKKHILEKMIYMAEFNKKNIFITQQIFDSNKYKLNLYHGDSLKLDTIQVWGIDNFEVVIGNPPYNVELKTKKGSASALYNKFIEYYIEKCDMMSFIIPSRWFTGGKGLDKFRKNMLQRKDIVYIKHFDDASKIFGNNVSIEGGVNYFLKDNLYQGDCNFNGNINQLNKYDVFIDSKYYKIIDKIINNNIIDSIFIGQSYSGINSNDIRLKDNETNTTLKCYVSKSKGFIKYIEKNKIFKDRNFNKWKVITARANGNSGCFGNMFIGKPNEICNQSYILFEVKNEFEAKSLLSYLKCRLPNLLLSLRKCSQDISGSTCKFIPLPPLDRIWNNKDVYKYLKLSDEDIELINVTKIKGYKENI